MRRSCSFAILLLASHPGAALAQEGERVASRPDAPDLRGGHLLIHASGGLWLPSAAIAPASADAGDFGAGAAARLRVGLGLGRYAVLAAEGGVGVASGDSPTCAGCSLLSVETGGALVFHPAQGFALDPWIGYGLGLRYTSVDLAGVDPAGAGLASSDDSAATFDVAKISLGGDFYPTPSFGFGPYIGVDIGLRNLLSAPAVYGIFQLGLRLSFDPFRAGASGAPRAQMHSAVPR